MSVNKNNANNWLIFGGIALIAILLFIGYRIVAVSIGPVKVEFENQSQSQQQSSSGNQEPTPQNPSPVDPPYQPRGIENPSGVVSSSETILSDNYALNFVSVTPNPNLSDYLRVKLVVTNYSSNPRIFRFVRNSVQMQDDTGYIYPNDNPADEIFRSVQVQMPVQEPVQFISTLGFDWIETTLLSFQGPIPPAATKLYINFNGFGPFSGFSIEVDL